MIRQLSAWLVRLVSMVIRAFGWRACRFHPTCSDYACEAFGRFSWLKAVWMSIARFLRCHPFSAGGFDPLPTKEI